MAGPKDKPADRAVGGIKIKGLKGDEPKPEAPRDVGELLRAADDERDPGRSLARCLFVLFKVTAMYDLKNAGVRGPIERTLKAVTGYLARDGVLSVQQRHDGLYVNNGHVPPDAGLEELKPYLEAAFKKLGVHEVVFSKGFDEAALRSLLEHVQGVATGKREAGEYRWDLVQLRELPKERAYEERREREKVVTAYAMACIRTSEVLGSFARAQMPAMPRLKSALTGVLDLPAALEPVLIGALAVGRENPSAWGLATNCAVLTGLVGKRLGLNRRRLLAAATAAALHDLAASLSDEPRDRRRALRLVAQVPNAQDALASWAVAIAETGAPAASKPLLLARLITLVRAFELLVTGSPTRAPLTQDQALRALAADTRGRYDGGLFALLCRTIGLLPPGTLLQLDSGGLGVVASVPTEASKLMLPAVRLVGGDTPGALLDLATANPPRKAVRSLTPGEAGVNPVHWLLA